MLKFITRLFHKPEKVVETVEQPRRIRGSRQYYDGPDDFKEGEVVTGIFVKFYQERHSDLGYALMSLEDGRKTRVSLQYLKRYWPAIDHLKYGDRLTLIRHDQDYAERSTEATYRATLWPPSQRLAGRGRGF